MFGGEFYNGQKTLINNELLFYQIKRKEWTQVRLSLLLGQPFVYDNESAQISSKKYRTNLFYHANELARV